MIRPLVELMEGFVEASGRIIVCSPCAKRRGIAETDLVGEGAVIAGGAAVVALMAAGPQTISY